MDCYWWMLTANLTTLTAGLFASLWWLARRRYLELWSVHNAYLVNISGLERERATLEYERWLHQQRLQGSMPS